MNVFIVATSHNYIQVREAIKYYNLDKKETILLFMHSRNDKPNLSVFPEGVKCLTFCYWTTKGLISSRHDYRVFVSFLIGLKNQCSIFYLYSNFYTSDYVLIAASILKPRKFVLMDEGTASIGVVLKRRKNKNHYLKCVLKSALYFRKILMPEKIVFFSQYPLNFDKPDTLDQYFFEKEQNAIIIDQTYAIILGQPLSEASIVDETFYLDVLLMLYNQLNECGFRMVEYRAHRREDPEKLDRIQSMGLEVYSNKEPFELAFQRLNPCPSVIYAFYSPILDNLSKKFTCVPEFKMIEIPEKHLSGDSRFIIPEIYKVFKKNPNLKIVTL